MVLAAAAQVAALRRERAGDVAALLGLARAGALLLAAGAVVVLAGGFWLLAETAAALGDGWVLGALALLFLAGVLGAHGGRKPRLAREAVARQPPDEPADPRARELLADRAGLAANAGAAAAALAVLALMVWQPG